MDRRTFVKMAAGTAMLGQVPPVAASSGQGQGQGKTEAWPDVVSFDSPIGHPCPVHFVEELPLVLRAYTYKSSFEKELELFRWTAHEWCSEAVLFRGIRIKLEPELLGIKPNLYVDGRKVLDSKLSLYVDDQKVLDGACIADFMKEGGGAFPLRGGDPTKALSQVFRGWVEKDGYPDSDRFLGYFIPSKICVVGKIEFGKAGSIKAEIELDMARYSTKKQGHKI